MAATLEHQVWQRKIQAYSNRLRAELFRTSRKRTLVAFYNRPENLAVLWARIEDANRWTCNDGILINEIL